MSTEKEWTFNLSPENSRRAKRISIIAAVVLVPLIMFDIVFLKGDVVARASSLRLTTSEPQELTFEVDRVDEKHTLRLNTYKRELALEWTVLNPEGEEIVSESEMMRHDGTRFDSFVPEATGEYKLILEGRRAGMVRGFTTRDRVSVEVQVGNRQILGPLFNLFKF